MDLLEEPISIQSLMDSDIESVESLQYLDIEELDEVEYALPTRDDAPTLAEVLSSEVELDEEKDTFKIVDEPACSALQVDFLQAISQQLTQAQERSSAGVATALGIGTEGKLTLGTAHGHLLSFHEQTLRWVCDSNADCGAVSSLAYNHDGTRILVGYARGLISQYESIRGIILRRVTLGGEIWGILKVAWAGISGLGLDTGGSVWIIKFSRPLGVRSARSTCLFSGARGEVVAMAPRDARVLALSTLSRVVIVAGGQAAGLRLAGTPDTLPVLAWCETDERLLVCARSRILQWLRVDVTGTSITIRPVQRVELKTIPLWLGWLGGSLVILDADEKVRLWGEDYDKPLDLSHIEPIYASAFFKGLWTDGRVSRAMCRAGESALAGVCVFDGRLLLLGRRGVVRVKPRDLLARTQNYIDSENHLQALRLLCSTQGEEAAVLAYNFILKLSEKPKILDSKQIADHVIKICLKYNLSDELWNCLWEQCSSERAFIEALGEAAARGDLNNVAPSPECSHALLDRLTEYEPGLVERVVTGLPLTSLDPHRASVLFRSKRLWRGVGAVAAALDGNSGAMRQLVSYVDVACPNYQSQGTCECAGGALLLAAADALAGRGAGGRPLPAHARPSARHDALQTLMNDEAGRDGLSPLQILVMHDARATVKLLEQSAREPPFVGPLGKQNRLKVARALLSFTSLVQAVDEREEILEFVTGQINSGALPPDRELIKDAQDLALRIGTERSERAWLALAVRAQPRAADAGLEHLRAARDALDGADRPRILWRLSNLLGDHEQALQQFFNITSPSTADIDELFEYLHSRIEAKDDVTKMMQKYLPTLINLRPRATAALIKNNFPELVAHILQTTPSECACQFAECLLENGHLQGDATVAHMRNLCLLRPGEVKTFLFKNVGIVRPEDALELVRTLGPPDAEPVCLEAIGDHSGALEALLKLSSNASEENRSRFIRDACELCSRVSPTVPPNVAADMWTRLLRQAPSMPPALILEAVTYLPADELVEKMCGSSRGALAVLECAASGRRTWACGARLAAREAHEVLVRTLRSARRALVVRGRCAHCKRALISGQVRTAHCGRAFHTECHGERSCGTCNRRLPELVQPLPSAPPNHSRVTAPLEHNLLLLAPPRPDLEGMA